MEEIIGAGGGKSGGDAHVATEASDSLRSKSYIRVLELISEGEISGLVNGDQSIYFDKVPLQNANGTYNFKGVTTNYRTGTQGQTYIPGFSSTEAETSVNVKVNQATPVVRTISNTNNTAVRVRVNIPALRFQDLSNGDITGTTVQYRIDIQSNGGGYVSANCGAGWVTNDGAADSSTQRHTATNSTRIKGYVSNSYTGAGSNTILVEYRLTGSTTWLSAGVTISYSRVVNSSWLKAIGGAVTNNQTSNPFTFDATVQGSPISFLLPTLANGLYDVRITRTSGSTAVLSLTSLDVFASVAVVTVSGKANSPYQRSHRIQLTGSPPWDIKVTRITADNALSNLSNDVYFDAYTQIVEGKFSYPNSALVGIGIDASQFSTIPTRGYDVKLLKVKIPSNYNPITRVYTGVWDGTFTVAWTDNPAWCFYDLVTNPRYGLGKYVGVTQIDKFGLYTIAKYCDANTIYDVNGNYVSGGVPDGFGGFEPRFRLNVYIQTVQQAITLLSDLAATFQSMVYYANGSVSLVQDSPANAVYLYSQANVVNGEFNYSGSSLRARHTTCLVTWNDPADFYTQKIEYVEDTAGIALYGIVQAQISAMGCTSRGQAHRKGAWLLATERLLNGIVTFQVGLDGVVGRPGQVIKVADSHKSAVRLSGRLTGTPTGTVLPLDAPATLTGGYTYTMSVMSPDGTVQSQTVTTPAGTVQSIAVGVAFNPVPVAGAIWMLESTQVVAQSYRIISIAENDKHLYTITAMQHNESLYGFVESNLVLESPNTTLLPPLPAAPDYIIVDSHAYAQAGTSKIRLALSWPPAANAKKYRVSYRRQGDNWITLTDTNETTLFVQDVPSGTYDAEIFALDDLNRRSAIVFGTGVVTAKGTPPNNVTGFSAQQNGTVVLLRWDQVTDLDVFGYEFRYVNLGSGQGWDNGLVISSVTKGTQITTAAVPPGVWTLMAKAVDAAGNYSVTEATYDIRVINTLVLISQQVEQPNWFNINPIMDSGTAQAGAASSITLQSGASAVDDFYKYYSIFLLDGTNRHSRVTAYNGTTKVATVSTPWGGANPNGSTLYQVVNDTFVKHWTGVIVPNNQDQVLSTDWATFDSYVINPVALCTYEGVQLDSLSDGDERLWVDEDSNLGPGVASGAPDPNFYIRYRKLADAYNAYQLWGIGFVTARYIQGKIIMDTTKGIPLITGMKIVSDRSESVQGAVDVVVPSTGLVITFSPQYRLLPRLSVSVKGSSLNATYTANTVTGFTAHVFDITGTEVGGTISWSASGV